MRTFVILLAVAGCGGPQAAAEIGTNRLKVEWRAMPGERELAEISLVVEGKAQPLGQLFDAADDAPSTPATCKIRKADATATEFGCGNTPAYNYFVAEIKAGQLIVTKISGVGDDPNAEERKIVASMPVTQTSFTVLPYVAPAVTAP